MAHKTAVPGPNPRRICGASALLWPKSIKMRRRIIRLAGSSAFVRRLWLLWRRGDAAGDAHRRQGPHLPALRPNKSNEARAGKLTQAYPEPGAHDCLPGRNGSGVEYTNMAFWHPALGSCVEPDIRPTIQRAQESAALANGHSQLPRRVGLNAGCSASTSPKKCAMHPARLARWRATPEPTRILWIATLDLHGRARIEANRIRVFRRVSFGYYNEHTFA